MTIEQLLQWRERRPFVPYRVVLHNGDAIDILKTTSLGGVSKQIHVFYPDLRRHRVVNIDEVAMVEPLRSAG